VTSQPGKRPFPTSYQQPAAEGWGVTTGFSAAPCPSETAFLRRIARSSRSRVARDSATALSHIALISACTDAEISLKGGA
jgi:hypothetical protein